MLQVVDMDDPSIARDITVYDYLDFAAIALLYYDHILTFSDEYTLIWRHPKSLSSVGFFINRYLPLFANIAIITLTLYPSSEDSCKRFHVFRQNIVIVLQVVVGVLLLLRTYALYDRNIRILALLVTAAILAMAAAVWSASSVAKDISVTTFLSSCHNTNPENVATYLAVAWAALFLYDTLIFSLTVWKTYEASHVQDLRMAGRPSLFTLMLRDGAAYFAVMALANLSNILTYYLASPILRGSLTSLANALSVTMMSRLILNLHEGAHAGIFSIGSTTMVAEFIFMPNNQASRAFTHMPREPFSDDSFTPISPRYLRRLSSRTRRLKISGPA